MKRIMKVTGFHTCIFIKLHKLYLGLMFIIKKKGSKVLGSLITPNTDFLYICTWHVVVFFSLKVEKINLIHYFCTAAPMLYFSFLE